MFSSISRLKYLALGLCSVLLTYSGSSHACGPDYHYWYQLSSELKFDPEKPGKRDSSQLFYSFFPSLKRGYVDYSAEQKAASQGFYSALRSALKTHRPTMDQHLKNRISHLEIDDPHTWGSCASNTLKNIQTFAVAVIGDSQLDDAMAAELIALRAELGNACGSSKVQQLIERTKAGNTDYHQYLTAAAQFYQEDYVSAGSSFHKLSSSNTPWLSEIALYLRARMILLNSQKDWNGWSEEKQEIDQQQALRAVNEFNRYLASYPQGHYANSARGLIRRAYWLNNDMVRYQRLLREDIQTFLNQPEHVDNWGEQQTQRLGAYFQEFYNVYKNDDFNHQLALLESFLKNTNDAIPAIAGLKQFIALYHGYENGESAPVIATYQDQTSLNPAQRLLLIRAYEQTGQIEQAMQQWLKQETVNTWGQQESHYQLARLINTHQGTAALIKDTRIPNLELKRVYLAALCDDSLQQELLKEALAQPIKHMLFADLATRYLYKQDFDSLYTLMSAHSDQTAGEFSAIRTAVSQIHEQRALGKAYMNIGYFMKTNIEPIYALSSAFAKTDCGQNSLQNGAMGPYGYFNKSLDYFSPDDKSESEAKALYYLSRCFKIGNDSRSCRWGDQLHQGLSSKQAFTRLHRKYKASKWAKKAKYHY